MEPGTSPMTSTRFYVVDVTCKVLLIIFATLIFTLVDPFERNYAFDQEARYRPVLEESVPVWLAALLNIGIAIAYLVTIILTILINGRKRNIDSRLQLHRIAKVFLSLAGSCTITWAIVEPLKRFTSEPRPHFLARCYGGIEHIPLIEDLPNRLTNEICIQNYITLGRADEMDEKLINEDRLSFPSAHSAFTATVFIWMGLTTFYFSYQLKLPSYSSVGATMLVLLVCPLLFVATSRIRDLWHFPRDVLGGLAIGSSVSVWQYLNYFPLIVGGRTGAKAFFDDVEVRHACIVDENEKKTLGEIEATDESEDRDAH